MHLLWTRWARGSMRRNLNWPVTPMCSWKTKQNDSWQKEPHKHLDMWIVSVVTQVCHTWFCVVVFEGHFQKRLDSKKYNCYRLIRIFRFQHFVRILRDSNCKDFFALWSLKMVFRICLGVWVLRQAGFELNGVHCSYHNQTSHLLWMKQQEDWMKKEKTEKDQLSTWPECSGG